MMKKILFFDIDGTLLDHEAGSGDNEGVHSPVKGSRPYRCYCYGTRPYHFEELREELGIDSYVCLNGQYVVYEGKPIYGHPLAEDALQELTEQAVRLDHPIIYAGSEAMKMNVTEHVHIDSSWGS